MTRVNFLGDEGFMVIRKKSFCASCVIIDLNQVKSMNMKRQVEILIYMFLCCLFIMFYLFIFPYFFMIYMNYDCLYIFAIKTCENKKSIVVKEYIIIFKN